LPVDIFDPGFVSIGRVAVARDFRGQGIGRTLVKRVLDAIAANGSTAPIKIIAQEYLEAFYRSFGFKTVGRAFLHDGQPHVPMVKI
jgi:ElaA protein